MTIRGTTPINVFEVDVDLRAADVIYITYAQNQKTVIERTKEDITVEEGALTLKLTQEETLRLKKKIPLEIQARARFPDGTALASGIVVTTVENVLKDGVI